MGNVGHVAEEYGWGKGGYGGKPWKVALCSWAAEPEPKASAARYGVNARSIFTRSSPAAIIRLHSLAALKKRAPSLTASS